MFDDFLNFVRQTTWSIFGSKYDRNEKAQKVKPSKRSDETDAQYFQRIINFNKEFDKKYWRNAYLKRVLIPLAVVLLLTNPNLREFKEHLGRVEYNRLSRQYQFFFFSVYKFDYYGGWNIYLGIAGNFIDITV